MKGMDEYLLISFTELPKLSIVRAYYLPIELHLYYSFFMGVLQESIKKPSATEVLRGVNFIEEGSANYFDNADVKVA